MFTKERDGGNMDEEELKQIEIIEINSNGVFPTAHNRHEWLDLDVLKNNQEQENEQETETEGNEIQEILSKNGVNLLLFYSYNEKIVYALRENSEQLKAYMETCRKSSYPAKKVDVPDIIPKIEYDLRDLKNWYLEIEDEELRKRKQTEIFKEARDTQKMLGDKVTIKIGILLKAYFSVQELLLNRKKEEKKALPAGIEHTTSYYRRSFYSPKNREAVDRVSEAYKVTQPEKGMVQEKEDDEILAK